MSVHEWKAYKNRIYILLGLAIFSLFAGIIGFMIFERYSFLEAFYLTVITVSTVGFEEVKPLSQAGHIFTALFILTNIDIFTYALSVISAFIFNGNIRYRLQLRRMRRKIKSMNDHAIICGFGRHGKEVVLQLETQNESGEYSINPEANMLLEKGMQLIVPGDKNQMENLNYLLSSFSY